MTAHTLILGGGLAGAAAAITLGRAGLDVILVERDTAPKHKVCGEFLSAEALQLLTHLGLNLRSEVEHSAPVPSLGLANGHASRTQVSNAGQSPGDAATVPGLITHPIHTVRLASAHHLTEARLPFPAQSLTRQSLDSVLLHAAQNAGAAVLRGSIEQLTPTVEGWDVTLHSGQVLDAPHAILATGKYDLRGFPRAGGRQNDLVALKMYWKPTAAQSRILGNAVELHLFPHGYFGLQPVEDGAANLTALVRKSHLARLGGWPGLLAEIQATNPHSAERLQGATPLLDKPLALSAIPYGFVRRQALSPTLYAVGDQAAVIPSFTGDGMSIALYTGIAAAQAILAGQPATLFQTGLHKHLRQQVARATLLSRALIHPTLRWFLTDAAHLWPGGLRIAASLTRLPSAALKTILPALAG